MKTTLNIGLKRMLFQFVGALFLTACVFPAGAIAGNQVLPGPLENRLSGNGTAEDHLTAATLYQHEAQRYENESKQYEKQAASITPVEDPKGFRRTGLMRAADSLRKKAGDMNQLYAAHTVKAETMMGMHPRQ
jgi:hypothetical protein